MRPSSRSPRPLLGAAVLVVLLSGAVAGCGDGDDIGGGLFGRRSSPTTVDDPGGEPGPEEGDRVPAEVVVLERGRDAAPATGGPGLLVDQVDLDAFAGRFLAGQAELVADRADGRGDEVFVGGVVSSGCFAPDGVELRRSGTDLRLVPLGLEDDPDVDCAEAVVTVALVAVDAGEVPDGATVGGEPLSAPVGPGTVRALELLPGPVEPTSVVVDGDGDVDRLLAGVEGAPPAATLDLPKVEEGQRRLAFLTEGCQASTAEVVVGEDGDVAVALRQEGEEHGAVTACDAAEPYLVVIDVPEGRVS